MKFFESPAPGTQINAYLRTNNVLIPLCGAGNGIFVHIKEISFRGRRPHLTLDGSFGEMTRPLCVSKGMDINQIQQLQDSSAKISLKKMSLGESVFFLTPRIDKGILYQVNKMLDAICSHRVEYWLNQGLQLKPNEVAKINGQLYTEQQCYLKALSISKNVALVWNRLGATLPRGELKIDGETVNAIYCYKRAIQLDEKAVYWCNLGLTLARTRHGNLPKDGQLSVQQCYVNAIKLDPNYRDTWIGLGRILEPSAGKSVVPVLIDNEWMEATDCYAKAVEVSGPEHQRSKSAWRSLAIALDKDETAIVANDIYSKYECFLQALRVDQNNADLWAKTGFHTPEEIGSIMVNGATYSKVECQLKALTIDPYDFITWNYLGKLLEKDSIDIDGEHYNAQKCFVQALTLVDNRFSEIWTNLGNTLGPDESVKVNGENLNQSQCYARSLKLNPHNPFNSIPLRY